MISKYQSQLYHHLKSKRMKAVSMIPGFKLFRWENRELDEVNPRDFVAKWVNSKQIYFYPTGQEANLCQSIHFKRAAAIFLTRWRRAKGLVKKRKPRKANLGNTTLMQDAPDNRLNLSVTEFIPDHIKYKDL